jgi:magnesium chelatase family protein
VLFLDELPEFDRRVLEALREPLESGCISLSRATARYTLPAQFQLIAAMNPCPCGYRGDTRQVCRCSFADLMRYRRRISGPLLDRIDLRIETPRLTSEQLAAAAGVAAADALDASARAWSDAPELVRAARDWRVSRSGGLSARLSLEQLQRCCALTPATSRLLQRSCEQLALSARGVQRLLAVSRTIADLAASETIEPSHLAEAVQLRRYWASETM